MAYSDLKFVNALGGISAFNEETGVSEYFDPGSEGHAKAEAGQWGTVAALPDVDPSEVRLSARLRSMGTVDAAHSQFLRQLTGNATIEERDTWKTKEEAARALIAGTASEGQTAMIGFEAAGAGVEPDVLAQTIIAKAEAFQALIGKAAGLRAKAKAAIAHATDEAVPLEQVEPALSAIFDQLAAEAETAVAEWQAGAG